MPPPTKKGHSRGSRASAYVCVLCGDDPQTDEARGDLAKSPQIPTLSKSVATPTLDEVKSIPITPIPAYSMPSQALSAPESPFMQGMSSTTSKGSTDSKQFSSSLSAQYIACCKCGKHRAVPSYTQGRGVRRRTLDVSLLPHFECSMNIWDDNKYNSCLIEENVDINYSINLAVAAPSGCHA